MSSKRISAERRLWLAARLSDRDQLVLGWAAKLRLITGQQLEALCFGGLKQVSRPVVRGRVLGRLVTWGLLEVVDRRVGGSASGSTSPVYRLSSAGHAMTNPAHAHPVRPYTDRFTLHTLAVSQLAAELVTATGADNALTKFLTEPASWAADGLGGYLKPDAYLQLESPDVTTHWWLEADLATESLPTLDRKLRNYLDFVNRGQRGPADVVPRVLITVPNDQRLTAVTQLLDRLPEPASELFVATTSGRAVATLLGTLRE